MRRRLAILATLIFALGLAVAAAGCGGDEGEDAAPAEPAEPAAPPADTGGADTGATDGEEPAPPAEPLTLRIGISAALSGPYAAYDQPLVNGMEFAADEVNAAGGPVTVCVWSPLLSLTTISTVTGPPAALISSAANSMPLTSGWS